MASKLDYLKKYISAAPPEEVGPQRKKKKKAVEDKRKGGGLQIIDEDAQVRWQSKMRVQQEEIEDDVPVVVEVEEDNDPLRKFKTKQSGSWASVDASAAQKAPPSGAADVSPPRRRRLDEVADSSPPRRGAPDADSSPPRRRPAVDDADSSPPRRRPARPPPGDARWTNRTRLHREATAEKTCHLLVGLSVTRMSPLQGG
eukprot:tig00000203_g17136.t1